MLLLFPSPQGRALEPNPALGGLPGGCSHPHILLGIPASPQRHENTKNPTEGMTHQDAPNPLQSHWGRAKRASCSQRRGGFGARLLSWLPTFFCELFLVCQNIHMGRLSASPCHQNAARAGLAARTQQFPCTNHAWHGTDSPGGSLGCNASTALLMQWGRRRCLAPVGTPATVTVPGLFFWVTGCRQVAGRKTLLRQRARRKPRRRKQWGPARRRWPRATEPIAQTFPTCAGHTAAPPFLHGKGRLQQALGKLQGECERGSVRVIGIFQVAPDAFSCSKASAFSALSSSGRCLLQAPTEPWM